MKLRVCVLCRWVFFHAVGQRVIISSCQECKEFPVRLRAKRPCPPMWPLGIGLAHLLTVGMVHTWWKQSLISNLETADREKGIARICLCSSCFVYWDLPVHFCFCALRFKHWHCALTKIAVNQTSGFMGRQALVDLVFCHLLSAGFWVFFLHTLSPLLSVHDLEDSFFFFWEKLYFFKAPGL